ncbi:MAG TPA: hypothetical protein VFZ61_09160, partial [Polyangiales bacterium]
MGELRDKLLRIGGMAREPSAESRGLGGRLEAREDRYPHRAQEAHDTEQQHAQVDEYAQADADDRGHGEPDVIVDEYGEVHVRAPSRVNVIDGSGARQRSIHALREQMARVAIKLQRAPVPPSVMPSSYAMVAEPDVPFAPATGLPGELVETLDGPLRFERILCDEDHTHG